nr:hypothetical protein CFP56_31637 [Quercus suber]
MTLPPGCRACLRNRPHPQAPCPMSTLRSSARGMASKSRSGQGTWGRRGGRGEVEGVGEEDLHLRLRPGGGRPIEHEGSVVKEFAAARYSRRLPAAARSRAKNALPEPNRAFEHRIGRVHVSISCIKSSRSSCPRRSRSVGLMKQVGRLPLAAAPFFISRHLTPSTPSINCATIFQHQSFLCYLVSHSFASAEQGIQWCFLCALLHELALMINDITRHDSEQNPSFATNTLLRNGFRFQEAG